MTSFITHKKQTNTLYVNTMPVHSSIVDTNLSTIAWATLDTFPYLSTPGMVLLRDMGKAIYIPDPKDPSNQENIILKKVQLVTNFHTHAPIQSQQYNTIDCYIGYIRIGNGEFIRTI